MDSLALVASELMALSARVTALAATPAPVASAPTTDAPVGPAAVPAVEPAPHVVKPLSPEDLQLVAPTGINAHGVTRMYPTPHPEMGENESGYVRRIAQMVDQTTHKPYFPFGRLGIVFQGGLDQTLGWPEAVDKLNNPYDWETQADFDARAAAAKRDAGASWGAGS